MCVLHGEAERWLDLDDIGVLSVLFDQNPVLQLYSAQTNTDHINTLRTMEQRSVQRMEEGSVSAVCKAVHLSTSSKASALSGSLDTRSFTSSQPMNKPYPLQSSKSCDVL